MHAVFGNPPHELCAVIPGAQQFSPLMPGSNSLENYSGTFESFAILAPPGTIERRYVIAKAIQTLEPNAPCTVLAPKDKGGSRLAKELQQFGCEIEEDARSHHRICTFRRPQNPMGLAEAISEGSPRFMPELQMHTQPGVFSWNRFDPASVMLLEQIPAFAGNGADLGCGIGFLSRSLLKSPKIKQLHIIDIDGRAIACAKQNLPDARVKFYWDDLRATKQIPAGLDFIVSNPPFHDGGTEDQSLGKAFLRQASALLRAGGVFWMVANKHLPYESILKEIFTQVNEKAQNNGFKIFEAIR